MPKSRILVGVQFAAGVAIVALILSLARPHAAQAETPSQFITSLGDTAIEVLVDDTLTDAERVESFRGLMVERFDLPLISRYVLGLHWRRASAEQRDEYSVLFEAFLVRIYSSRLGTYGSETLLVKSARQGGKKDTIVSTDIGKKGGPLVEVNWRVRNTDHGYKVVDIIIEGISMVITQRDEFASVIRRSGGNLEGLLAKLRETTSPAGDRQLRQAQLD